VTTSITRRATIRRTRGTTTITRIVAEIIWITIIRVIRIRIIIRIKIKTLRRIITGIRVVMPITRIITIRTAVRIKIK
jgi:hypothetical protein